MQKRRLAAIMFTDIVGYTSLMGRDAEKGLELLRRNREIQIPSIRKHGGKWLKEMGDGTLAQFDSAIDSVLCALEIEKMARTKLGAKLRIGIHLGDVTLENEDVFGDGVNIASRLQSIADPGGVYISESIYEAIRARKDIRCEMLGDIRLKNVDHPVKTYFLRGKGLPVPSARKKNELTGLPPKPLLKQIWFYVAVLLVLISVTLTAVWILSSKNQSIRSIAVLPVENLSGNADEEWLEAGIHTGLIDELAKIGELRVIGRRSTLKYVDTDKAIPEIATELDVDGIVEAELSNIGSQLNIQIRFLQVHPEEKQIWGHTYEGLLKNLPSIYKNVARSIAIESAITLSPSEESYLSAGREVDPKAYEAYLRGMSYCENGTKPDVDKALEYFQHALEIDPAYALAYHGIAFAWALYSQNGFLPPDITRPKTDEADRKALELDSTLVELQGRVVIDNMYYAIIRGSWKHADIKCKKFIDTNPNYAWTQVYYGHLLGAIGRQTEGLTYSYKAFAIDPFNNLIQDVHAMNLKNARKYDEAFKVLWGLLKTNPTNIIGLPALWAVYHQEGKYTEALEVAKEIYKIKGNDLAIEALEAGYREGGYQMAMQRTAEKMIACRDSVYFPSWQIGTLYTRSGLKKEALDWLWKAYEDHDANIVVIGVDPLFDILRDEPRFQDLLRKMNLPTD